MHALKKVKMKKAKLFSTKDAVREARFSLEKKTEQAFKAFAKSKQNAQEVAQLKYLD